LDTSLNNCSFVARIGRRAALLSLPVLILFCSSRAFAQPISAEDQLKAVFLLRLAQFVSWPSNAFSGAGSPVVIGILGQDPFGEALDLAVAGEKAQGRHIVVRRFQRNDAISECHILFVSRFESRSASAITSSLRSRSILTVSDIEGFVTEHGGMVRWLEKTTRCVFASIPIGRGLCT
jgi:hypothetical protein